MPCLPVFKLLHQARLVDYGYWWDLCVWSNVCVWLLQLTGCERVGH